MTAETVGAALEREHHEIDSGMAEFAAGLSSGERRTGPLLKAIDALRRHIYIEEEMVFPSLRAAGMFAPIFVMLREHGEIWRDLDALEAEVSAGAPAAAMAESCKSIEQRLDAHNMKEEQILYPRTAEALGAAEQQDVDAFLASGEMPADWVCAGVRPGG